jgi:4-amino-4-deoxy-L-arabinose transferase-like glycosyltransferase
VTGRIIKDNIVASLKDPRLRLFAVILFVSLLLRVWGIWNIEQTDEFNEVFEALKVDSGHLNIERWNKKLLIYILAVEYGIFFGAGWVLEIYSGVSDFVSKIVINMTPLFIIGRVTSAVFGTLMVFVTYLIGKRLYSREAALIGILFLCFNYVHVEHSSLVLVDITMALMVVCSFYFSTLLMDEGRGRWYFLSGLFGGLAIVSKIPSIFILISMIIAHVLNSTKDERFSLGVLKKKELIYMIGGIVSGVILGNPAILIGLPKYFEWLRSLFGAYQGTADIRDYWTPVNGYKFYFFSLYRNLGLPLLILTLLSLLYYLFKPKKEDLLTLSFPLPFYLVMANSKWVLTDRYMIPIYPFLSILAAAFVVEIMKRLPHRKKMVIASLLILMLITPVIKVALFKISLLDQNTRYWAKEWIEANIPPGSKILIDSGRTINTYSPPIFNNRENLISIMDRIETLQEGQTFDDSRIVDSKSSVYFKYLLNNLPEITYDLTSTELGTKAKSPEYYRKNGYDYVITSSLVKWRAYNDKWASQYPEAANFYKSLDKGFQVVREFKPSLTRSGPTITIYKVK